MLHLGKSIHWRSKIKTWPWTVVADERSLFAQADPFPHNEYFLELVKQPAMLGKVQTMSRLYLSEGQFETPKAAGMFSTAFWP